MKKRGISLIVLLITIIVMIILAGVVIIGIVKDNPIEKAAEATFKTDLTLFKNELNSYHVSEKAKSRKYDSRDINASGEEMKKYISSITDKYIKQLEIVNGKIVFIGTAGNEIEWSEDSDIEAINSVKTSILSISKPYDLGISQSVITTDGAIVVAGTIKENNKVFICKKDKDNNELYYKEFPGQVITIGETKNSQIIAFIGESSSTLYTNLDCIIFSENGDILINKRFEDSNIPNNTLNYSEKRNTVYYVGADKVNGSVTSGVIGLNLDTMVRERIISDSKITIEGVNYGRTMSLLLYSDDSDSLFLTKAFVNVFESKLEDNITSYTLVNIDIDSGEFTRIYTEKGVPNKKHPSNWGSQYLVANPNSKSFLYEIQYPVESSLKPRLMYISSDGNIDTTIIPNKIFGSNSRYKFSLLGTKGIILTEIIINEESKHLEVSRVDNNGKITLLNKFSENNGISIIRYAINKEGTKTALVSTSSSNTGDYKGLFDDNPDKTGIVIHLIK